MGMDQWKFYWMVSHAVSTIFS